ncbi:hypothetical protein N7476_004627 [Penicillium atrosanguineum]|uniref:Uncharacterized protein n=1 Tax=Penicillium atrosanguineum TaxID=1132637 RepID=A0A9W9U6V1_9EURO|nr:hypothetical protein N7476_004627 [Penicillium atrosanguineum]
MAFQTHCCLCPYAAEVKPGSFIPNIHESLLDITQYNVEIVEKTMLCFTGLASSWLTTVSKSEAEPSPKIYTLRESTLKNANAWLQKQIEQGSEVYFVVGLRTLVDPTALREGGATNERISGVRVKRVLWSPWGRVFNWFFGSFDIKDVRMEKDSWWMETPSERWLFGAH